MNTSASWVIISRATNRAIFETYSEDTANNIRRYSKTHEVVGIKDHLQNLNRKKTMPNKDTHGRQRCRTEFLTATGRWHVLRPSLGTKKTVASFNTEAAANKRRDFENAKK